MAYDRVSAVVASSGPSGLAALSAFCTHQDERVTTDYRRIRMKSNLKGNLRFPSLLPGAGQDLIQPRRLEGNQAGIGGAVVEFVPE